MHGVVDGVGLLAHGFVYGVGLFVHGVVYGVGVFVHGFVYDFAWPRCPPHSKQIEKHRMNISGS